MTCIKSCININTFIISMGKAFKIGAFFIIQPMYNYAKKFCIIMQNVLA